MFRWPCRAGASGQPLVEVLLAYRLRAGQSAQALNRRLIVPHSSRKNPFPRLQILRITSKLLKQLNSNKPRRASAGPRSVPLRAALLCLCCAAAFLSRGGERVSGPTRQGGHAFTTNTGSAKITAGILTRTLSLQDGQIGSGWC